MLHRNDGLARKALVWGENNTKKLQLAASLCPKAHCSHRRGSPTHVPQVPLVSVPASYQGYLSITHVSKIRGFGVLKAKEGVCREWRGSRAHLDAQPAWFPVITTYRWCVLCWHFSERLECILSLDVTVGCNRISVNSHFTDGEIETQPSKASEEVTQSVRDRHGNLYLCGVILMTPCSRVWWQA